MNVASTSTVILPYEISFEGILEANASVY